MSAETAFRPIAPLAEESRVAPRRPVLLVDDDPFILSVGALLLRRMGYAVETAESSTAALSAIIDEPERFGALVTDLNLGDASGADLIDAARALNPALPAVLMSGCDTLSTEGAETLSKPFTARDLAAAIARAGALVEAP